MHFGQFLAYNPIGSLFYVTILARHAFGRPGKVVRVGGQTMTAGSAGLRIRFRQS